MNPLFIHSLIRKLEGHYNLEQWRERPRPTNDVS